jgi:hypothetical protein
MNTTTIRAVPAAPGLAGNRWLTLFAMTGALSMIMLDQTVVTVALPSMTHDLGLSSSGQQWVVNASYWRWPRASPWVANSATGWVR